MTIFDDELVCPNCSNKYRDKSSFFVHGPYDSKLNNKNFIRCRSCDNEWEDDVVDRKFHDAVIEDIKTIKKDASN